MKKAPFAPPQWPATTVEMWPLGKIKPYPQNPRTHSTDQISILARSMQDAGVTMPILVDEAGVIIVGHGRRQAAEQNKFEKYPVVIARGWTEEQKNAVRIQDNAIGLLSGWDAKLIQSELGSLKLSGYDIALLGFPEAQLRGWGISAGPDNGNDPEETPEWSKAPVVRLGDLWDLGVHRLLCGDSTKRDDVGCLLGATSLNPNLMVTDPPYGVGYDPTWHVAAAKAGKIKGAGRRGSVGVVTNDHRSDWKDSWKLFEGDVAYIWHSGIFSSVVASSITESDFELRSQIIWAKTSFAISRGHYHWQHEPCWYAVRRGASAHWNGDRSQSTVWHLEKKTSDTGHGTQKPVECMRRPIENNSRKGEAVYDPFMGSGTTIIAAEMTGRQALGVELDPGYVQVAVERWQKFTGKLATLGGKTLEQVAAARRKGASAAKRKEAPTRRPSSKASPASPATSPNSG